jgi:hypothetical protein
VENLENIYSLTPTIDMVHMSQSFFFLPTMIQAFITGNFSNFVSRYLVVVNLFAVSLDMDIWK